MMKLLGRVLYIVLGFGLGIIFTVNYIINFVYLN